MIKNNRNLALAAALCGGIFLVGSPAHAQGGKNADLTNRVAALEAKIAVLEAKLQYVTVSGTEMYITGANLNIRSGSGWTGGTNGKGNLVMGYNEGAVDNTRTGSHNIVVGGYNTYASYGAMISGDYNQAWGPFASMISSNNVLATVDSQYSGSLASDNCSMASAFDSMMGSINCDTTGSYGSIIGGSSNKIFGSYSVLVSGQSNEIKPGALNSSILGGNSNQMWGDLSTILAGHFNVMHGTRSFIGAGYQNVVGPAVSSGAIVNGDQVLMQNNYSTIGSGIGVQSTANNQFKSGGLTG
jgi:hypothetical protein